MPTTRKQKKSRKSRGLEVLSDIEHLVILLGGDHFNRAERERSLDSTSARRRESIRSNNLENDGESLYSNHRNDELRTSADYGRNSADASSQAEYTKLSSELNSRISREMDEMMNSVSSQIQRAMNEAINNQVLPQIQNVVMAGSGRETRRGWEAPLERPEISTGVCRNQNAKAHLRSEQDDEQHIGELLNRNVHDNLQNNFICVSK